MMKVPEIAPEEARSRLESDGYIYLDVRTVEEFNEGRPPGAINIPVAEPDPATGRMAINPRFLPLVKAVIPPDTPVIVGCKSGPRSEAAARLMKQAGYEHVYNLIGGMKGATDPFGRVRAPGWATLGYPVESGDPGSRAYAALTRNARPDGPPGGS